MNVDVTCWKCLVHIWIRILSISYYTYISIRDYCKCLDTTCRYKVICVYFGEKSKNYTDCLSFCSKTYCYIVVDSIPECWALIYWYLLLKYFSSHVKWVGVLYSKSALRSGSTISFATCCGKKESFQKILWPMLISFKNDINESN